MTVYTLSNTEAVRLAAALINATLTGAAVVELDTAYQRGVIGVGDGTFAVTSATTYRTKED